MNETNTNTSNEPLSVGMVIAVIQDVLKRLPLILSVTLVAAMLAFVVTDFSYKPQYRTITTFVASAGGTSTTTYSNLNTANNLASVFTEVLNSSLLKQKVLEEAEVSVFDGTIEAKSIEDTNLLTMTVTGSDPSTVFRVSKAIIEHHHIVSDEVLGNSILEVLQNPIVPSKAINSPDVKGNMIKAAVVAVAAVTALLAVLSYMSDKVRSREEADNKLSCHVLGELYHERKNKTLKDWFSRKKKSILLSDPLTSFVYTEAVHKLSSRVDRHRHKGEHVIMVTSLLENEGKSTVAVNLALSMVKRGRKVLLIDCDLRKPACHLILGQNNKTEGVAEILHGQVSVKDCVQVLEHNGLHLLTSKKSLRTATNLVNSPAMKAMLQEAADLYDIVIVDTPPMSMAPDAECISEFADAALLVVRQNEAKVNDLEDAVSILDKADCHLLGCVLNNVFGTNHFAPAFSYGAYGYGKYSKYGKYGKYGYGKYGYGRSTESSDEEKA